jgi:hypothetical protein
MTLKRVYTSRNMVMYYQGSLKDFAEIAMAPKILAICLEIATEEAMPIAIQFAMAHVDDGVYIRSFRVRPTTVLLRGMRRVCAQLVNTAPHSALVEWGGMPGGGRYRGRYRPAQHILSNTRDRLTGRDGATDPDLMG